VKSSSSVVAFGLAEKVAEPPDLTKQLHMVIGRFTDCPSSGAFAFDAQERVAITVATMPLWNRPPILNRR
jgi:hypothetical protein